MVTLGSTLEHYNHALSVAGAGTATPADQAFVGALYGHLLGRAAGAGEAAYWHNQVATQGREAAVLLLTAGDEYRADVIQDAYRSLLIRKTPASSAEVTSWLSLTRDPENPGLTGGPEGGRIFVRPRENIDQESIKVAFEQTEEFCTQRLRV
jgi:hypothetical protein